MYKYSTTSTRSKKQGPSKAAQNKQTVPQEVPTIVGYLTLVDGHYEVVDADDNNLLGMAVNSIDGYMYSLGWQSIALMATCTE